MVMVSVKQQISSTSTKKGHAISEIVKTKKPKVIYLIKETAKKSKGSQAKLRKAKEKLKGLSKRKLTLY